MNPFIITFLTKCSECYYNIGEYYKANANECTKIESELGINNLFDTYPVEITDDIYDQLYDLAKQKYTWHEFFGMVGAADKYGEDIEFKNPAGSMTELKAGDWDKWKLNNIEYVVSEKLDGLSVVLFYKDGSLVKAASRGDGYKGKDITRHILHISNVPKNISIKEEVEVRGELICPKANIQAMIDELKLETNKEYKNGRNTIAGFLNSKNTLESVAKYAQFNAFDTTIEHTSEIDMFNKLNEIGFNTPHYFITSNKTEDELIEITTDIKLNSKYECDGIIITINNPTEQYTGFETGTINPKKSRKFKISNIKNTAETIVKDITWQVSRCGNLTPVIEIEPVNLCGATITRATGHNYKNIIDNKIGIGSQVEVIRSGDVIPYIKKVITTSDIINLPKVETIIDGVNLKIKDITTPSVFVYEMNIQKLVFFCKSLGIDGIAAGNLECLVKDFDNKYNKYMDCYDLLQTTKQVLFQQIGVNGEKIYESLQKSKENSSEVDYMTALSVFGEGIGKSILQSVFDKYHTLDVTTAQLHMLNGFGDTRIDAYISHIQDYRIAKEKLAKIGIVFNNKIQDIKSDKFANYIVCFTGVRDNNLSKIIRENGGIATDSWNKNVNLLVAKDPHSTSGKIVKAHEKGINVISIEEARKLFM